MSVALISSTIRDYLTANYSETEIAYENNFFDTPEKLPWIKLNILFNESEITSLGQSPCYRMQGIIDIQVFEYKESGTFETERLVDVLIDLFKFKNISGVKTFEPGIFKANLVDNWYQTNASFNFTFDTQ